MSSSLVWCGLAIRAAFDRRSIRRDIVVAEGDYMTCQTWIEGTFVREFIQSPSRPAATQRKARRVRPAQHLRFDDQGAWSKSGHASTSAVSCASSAPKEGRGQTVRPRKVSNGVTWPAAIGRS
jgi:hypothetical protein